MNDFDYDARQKKRVAASARRRKSGSRSRYVGLPSDHLTQKELRAMSGEVQTYNMNAPVRWSAFLSWPHDLQQEYVSKLQAEYGATGEMLAECFDTSRAIVIRGLKEAGIQLISQPRHLSKKDVLERTQRWHGFLYGDHGAPCEEPPEAKEPLGGGINGDRASCRVLRPQPSPAHRGQLHPGGHRRRVPDGPALRAAPAPGAVYRETHRDRRPYAGGCESGVTHHRVPPYAAPAAGL